MRVLLVGKCPVALREYKKLLEDYGIEADVGDDTVGSESYETVLHLWPMSIFLLGVRLRAAQQQKEKQPAAG